MERDIEMLYSLFLITCIISAHVLVSGFSFMDDELSKDPMNKAHHEILPAEITFDTDPRLVDKLNVTISTKKGIFKTQVQRAAASILMEDFNCMIFSSHNGKLKIKKEELLINVHRHAKHMFHNAELGTSLGIVYTDKGAAVQVEGIMNDEIFILPPRNRGFRYKRSVRQKKHTVWIKRHGERTKKEFFKDFQKVIDSLKRTNRYKRQSGTYVDVEVCVLVDFSLFKKSGRSITDLTEYMLHFWHAVNLRYQTIETMRINIKIKSFGIFEDEESEAFFKNSLFHQSNMFEARHALSDFQNWISQYRSTFYKFDIIYLLTGKDACVFNGAMCEKRVTGVSFVEGACQKNHPMGFLNAAISETDLVFRGVFTAAHEIGHLLGATHDGEENAVSCSINSGYLMSYNRSDPIKAHRFSECSIQAFKRFLRSPNSQCLWDRAVDAFQYPSILPGQQMKLKEQCLNYVKGEPCEVSEFQCHHLCCYDETRKLIFTRQQPAVHGTDCGLHPWKVHFKGSNSPDKLKPKLPL